MIPYIIWWLGLVFVRHEWIKFKLLYRHPKSQSMSYMWYNPNKLKISPFRNWMLLPMRSTSCSMGQWPSKAKMLGNTIVCMTFFYIVQMFHFLTEKYFVVGMNLLALRWPIYLFGILEEFAWPKDVLKVARLCLHDFF